MAKKEVKLKEWNYKNHSVEIKRYRVINKEGFFYNFDVFDSKRSKHSRINYGVLAKNSKDAKKFFKEAFDSIKTHKVKKR